ncbi:hypothetical protein Cci01nite_29690 [Catellatospora citrea]|uniref:Uncharacterized protein n=1 Tax=Catellatospora citrea TaxID=53366 RepID=A0A8J3KIZ5_9ACTN|nr:hypothetical protein Cci01nite_29690 [Catellatospora citrea]
MPLATGLVCAILPVQLIGLAEVAGGAGLGVGGAGATVGEALGTAIDIDGDGAAVGVTAGAGDEVADGVGVAPPAEGFEGEAQAASAIMTNTATTAMRRCMRTPGGRGFSVPRP